MLGEGVLETLPVDSAQAGRVVARSREVMDAESGLGLVACIAVAQLEGVTGYHGPITREVLEQSHLQCSKAIAHFMNAAAAAPEPAMELVSQSFAVLMALVSMRGHTLPQFSVEAILGKDGALPRQIIER